MLFVATRGLPLLLEIGLLVYCLVDCIQTPADAQRNLPKWGWLVLILLLPLIGSIAWLVAGRPDRRAARNVPWPATATAGFPEYERPRGPRGGRATAPDDDPAFLAGLSAQREDEQRLKAWEESLRRREEELKRPASPPDDAGPAAPRG